jgi:hypothetical protein
VSFNSDPLGEPVSKEDSPWLGGGGGGSPRSNVRRMWFAVLVLIVILVGLWWLIFRGLFSDDKLTQVPSPSTTVAQAPASTAPGGGTQFSAADQRVIADARRAMTAWGEFAISGDLSKLTSTFWKDGLQYQKLTKEAPGLKQKDTGPPPYQFTLTPSRVSNAPGGMKIVRGTVRVTRPGEQPQTFKWDIYLKRVPESSPEVWRLWTVAETPK